MRLGQIYFDYLEYIAPSSPLFLPSSCKIPLEEDITTLVRRPGRRFDYLLVYQDLLLEKLRHRLTHTVLNLQKRCIQTGW